ncbi:MAG: hypothetical protein VX007_01465, partial [Pseudomonadota bacterium]|nr:hypothetical protein [Pseudomonadota bacterium]
MSQTTDLDNNDVRVDLQFVVRANDASEGPDGALFSVQAIAELVTFGGIGEISDFVVRVQVFGWPGGYLDIPLSFSNNNNDDIINGGDGVVDIAGGATLIYTGEAYLPVSFHSETNNPPGPDTSMTLSTQDGFVQFSANNEAGQSQTIYPLIQTVNGTEPLISEGSAYVELDCELHWGDEDANLLGRPLSENQIVASAGGGDDIIQGGLAGLMVSGGEGNDKIYAGIGGGEIYAGAGNDIILAGVGDILIDAGSGDDTIHVNSVGGLYNVNPNGELSSDIAVTLGFAEAVRSDGSTI